MKEYYFLASLLPQLEIGHVPALGFTELKELLKTNLTDEDKAKVREFLRMIDFDNLRAYWAGEELDPRGNLNREEIEHSLANMSWPGDREFPLFMQDYLLKYHTNEERLKHFQNFLSQFYEYQRETQGNFLGDFFAFQRDWRLVMVGFRAKKLGKDLFKELQFEDPTDPIVAQILAQKDAKTFEPPFEYKDLKPIFEEYGDSPLELHKALYEYQFRQIVELWGAEHFTLDRILNYMARLFLVEKWLELDVHKGMAVVDNIERKIQ